MKFKNAVVGQRVIVKPNYIESNELISHKQLASVAVGAEGTVISINALNLTEKVRVKFDVPVLGSPAWWFPHSCLKRI